MGQVKNPEFEKKIRRNRVGEFDEKEKHPLPQAGGAKKPAETLIVMEGRKYDQPMMEKCLRYLNPGEKIGMLGMRVDEDRQTVSFLVHARGKVQGYKTGDDDPRKPWEIVEDTARQNRLRLDANPENVHWERGVAVGDCSYRCVKTLSFDQLKDISGYKPNGEWRTHAWRKMMLDWNSGDPNLRHNVLAAYEDDHDDADVLTLERTLRNADEQEVEETFDSLDYEEHGRFNADLTRQAIKELHEHDCLSDEFVNSLPRNINTTNCQDVMDKVRDEAVHTDWHECGKASNRLMSGLYDRLDCDDDHEETLEQFHDAATGNADRLKDDPQLAEPILKYRDRSNDFQSDRFGSGRKTNNKVGEGKENSHTPTQPAEGRKKRKLSRTVVSHKNPVKVGESPKERKFDLGDHDRRTGGTHNGGQQNKRKTAQTGTRKRKPAQRQPKFKKYEDMTEDERMDQLVWQTQFDSMMREEREGRRGPYWSGVDQPYGRRQDSRPTGRTRSNGTYGRGRESASGYASAGGRTGYDNPTGIRKYTSAAKVFVKTFFQSFFRAFARHLH